MVKYYLPTNLCASLFQPTTYMCGLLFILIFSVLGQCGLKIKRENCTREPVLDPNVKKDFFKLYKIGPFFKLKKVLTPVLCTVSHQVF
jgi:hypothetical protein